ncbi:molybdenum cofactor biosynthesis F family protein [Microbacterium sp. 22242]|uniref:molybdenum cofactor biosynthesis F family protein n=1 Tax=Microbacterium sp. 22242 TaxID=3453896 RepID=UPI003F85445F
MSMNPADTSTWLPLDGLAPGFDANKEPHTTALAGRRIDVTAPNGTRISHVFAENDVTWTYAPGEGDDTAAASDTDAYEAIEVDEELFYVQFHHNYKPNEAVSLILDLRAGRVLSIISEILPTAEKGRTRVQHRFGTATIDGIEATGSDFAPTTALIGRRVEWVYSEIHAYEHVYLSERWYTWQCLAGPERGLADTDENSVWEIRPGIYMFAWREKVIPCASITVADHRDITRIRSHGVLFGLDETGEIPTHFTFGAWGRLISMTGHAPELEPANFGA